MAVLWWSDAREFVVGSILEAICQGHELLRVWPLDAQWYNLSGYGQSGESEYFSPFAHYAQEVPSILAGLAHPDRVPGQHPMDGSDSGEFPFPVGSDSVRVAYSVRWERGIVAELRVSVPAATESLAAAAHQQMVAMGERRYLASRGQEAEPGAAADGGGV